MKCILLIVSLLIFPSFPCLGVERIEWINNVYNFGLIREEDGTKEGEFQFVNIGNKPVLIQRIKTSCGCTSVEFPKDYINRGDTATIRFRFNPARRPGKVDKDLKVYIDNIDEVFTLNFDAIVIGDEQTLSVKYPYERANLRLERLNLKTDTLIKGMTRHLFLEVYNQGNDTVKLFQDPTGEDSIPGIEMKLFPKEIGPGEAATLMFEIDSSKINGYGRKTFHPVLKWGNEKSDTIGIDVSTIILPQINQGSKEPKGRIRIINDVIEIDNFSDGWELSFGVENIGEGPLKLYGILTEQDGLIDALWPEEIAEGHKGEVKIRLFDGKIPSGVFRLKFDIISDDPYFPLSSCRIVGIK